MKSFNLVFAAAMTLGFLLIRLGEAKAATYYMSPTGNDTTNTGEIGSPFATLVRFHNLANPGDVIYLRGGTYNINAGIRFTRSGSSGAMIKVMAYPGEKPILNASGITTNDTWVIKITSTASWWHIKGLEIKNNPKGGGIYIGEGSNNNNIIENNNIHHNGSNSEWAASGISIYGTPSYNLVLNNDVHHNRDIDYGDADGISAGNLGVGNVYRGNRAWNNSDDGFDFFCVHDNKECSTVLLENNWAFDNGYDEYMNPVGNGNGFKLGGIRNATTGKSGGHTLRYNLAWSNRATGFDDNLSTSTEAQSKPNTLYNNTAWDNKENYYFSQSIHNLVNNISLGTFGYIKSSEPNNSWSIAATVNSADFASLDDTCARGPRKADGSLPDCSFLRLASSSDLINKGVNVGLPYVGSAPDMGAFEFSSSSPPPPPPPITLPDVVVTSITYDSKTGLFTSVVKNQGTLATPADVYVGVSYSVNGSYKTWGSVKGPLAVGASVTINTLGGAYIIPKGTHTIEAFADDAARFAETNEANNKLSKSVTIGTITPPPLPDVVVTSVTYDSKTGLFTSVVKNQGTLATPADVYVGVSYSVNGSYKTWGSVKGPLAAGVSVTIKTNGGAYFIPKGTHTIEAFADDAARFTESSETNNKLSKTVTIP